MGKWLPMQNLYFQPLPPPSGHLVSPGAKPLVCSLLASFYIGSVICCLCFKSGSTYVPAFNLQIILPSLIGGDCRFYVHSLKYFKFFYIHKISGVGIGKLPRAMLVFSSPGLSGNHLHLEFVLIRSGSYSNIVNWVVYKKYFLQFGRLGSAGSWLWHI